MRQKGQPIRLFAESDKERRLRLRALELIEERGTERHGGQNDFKKALEDVENVGRELDAKNKGGKKSLKDEVEQQVNGVLDLGLVKSDPDKLYPIIYYALKRTLKEWEEAMDERPGALNVICLFCVYHHQFFFTQSTLNGRHRENWQLLLKSNPLSI